jgi:hypothetical protein
MKRMVEICAVFVCGRGLEVDWSEQDGLGRERARACVCTSLEQKKRRQRGGEAETGERRRS